MNFVLEYKVNSLFHASSIDELIIKIIDYSLDPSNNYLRFGYDNLFVQECMLNPKDCNQFKFLRQFNDKELSEIKLKLMKLSSLK